MFVVVVQGSSDGLVGKARDGARRSGLHGAWLA
jgi:hypothetical protein